MVQRPDHQQDPGEEEPQTAGLSLRDNMVTILLIVSSQPEDAEYIGSSNRHHSGDRGGHHHRAGDHRA
jgi:hypothetical protein